MAKFGQKVGVNTGSEGSHPNGRDRIGFFIDAGADGKDTIQVGEQFYKLPRREEEDRDNEGSGVTWWEL